MAQSFSELGIRRLVLRHILAGFVVLGDEGDSKTVRAFNIPATDDFQRDFSVAGGNLLLGVAVNSIRFWQLYSSIPFALVYVYGIGSLCRIAAPILPRTLWFDTVLPLLVIGAIVVLTEASEIVINRPVFASEHNWFHL